MIEGRRLLFGIPSRQYCIDALENAHLTDWQVFTLGMGCVMLKAPCRLHSHRFVQSVSRPDIIEGNQT